MLDVAAACLVITALLSWVNQKFLRAPATIGVMAVALVLSLLIVAMDALGVSHGLLERERAFVSGIDFSDVLMRGMLSLLLFAGALHIDLAALKAHRWPVLILAVVGTVLSSAIVGVLMWALLPWVGIALPLRDCLLFGALISPTDPIAVIGIMKSAGAPKELELVISGESLFNDGVGVVIFAAIAGIDGATEPSFDSISRLLMREAGGGIIFGLALGYLTYRLLKSVDEYQVEVLLTLAAVTGGYALATHLHVSGPLAMVVTGLVVGNHGRRLAMSDTTRRYVDMFWELIDGILNAVLFVLIGLQILFVEMSSRLLMAGVLAVVVTLTARWISVGLPVLAWGTRFGLGATAWRVMTWGGLRGGISVALVLALPAGPARDNVLTLTYCVVVFSILVQGLTIGRVVRRALATAA